MINYDKSSEDMVEDLEDQMDQEAQEDLEDQANLIQLHLNNPSNLPQM